MVVVSLFYMEISKSVNKNMLNNFFMGTYNQPVTEEGIFMFVDMKSSTSHAEKLGHELYFKMLQEYYKDLSIAIVKYKGDIYQYAGDQVIVTWTLQRGLTKKRCARCFLSMRKIFERNKDKYLQKYGVFPEFKAGLHTGLVTTGEIGELKKEILFTGDVLNSTARIQDLCKDFNVDNLFSKELLNKLDIVNSSKVKRIGQVKLKGKKVPTELYTLI
jgi:class 3 adenylate cyclase